MAPPCINHNNTDYNMYDVNCNKKTAQQFLNHFSKLHHFICIHPHKDNKNKIRIVGYGTLQDHFEQLQKLNRQGYGVFFCVNDVGGTKRTISKLKGCRCIFQEDDNDYQGSFPIGPTIVVQSSPGKYHRYWLVKGQELTVSEFNACMSSMVESYGCDESAHDAVRVLRVPGFYHTKRKPVMVEVIGKVKKKIKKKKLVREYVPTNRVTTDFKGNETLSSWSIGIERTWRHDMLAMQTDICKVLSAMDVIGSENYNTWIDVGMILKSTYGNRKRVFKWWNTWSKKSSKYPGSNTLLYKWSTFANVPGVTGVREKNLLSLYAMAHKREWDQNTGKIDKWEEKNYKLSVLNDHVGHITIGGKPVLLKRKINEVGNIETDFWAYEALSAELSNVFVLDGKDKRIPICKAWNLWENKRKFTSIVQIKNEQVKYEGKRTRLPHGCTVSDYVGYTGLTRKPVKGKWVLIGDHILNCWCRGDLESYRYVMGWLANMLLRPWEAPGTCIVLKSMEGVGKGIILEPLVEMLGNGAIELHRTEDITGRFNMSLYAKFFVYGNEVSWGGNKRGEGVLKGLITDKHKQFEQKFISPITGLNMCHLLLSSNSDWIVPVSIGARRFFILDCNDSFRKNASNNSFDGHEYFENLAKEIRGGGIESFVYELLNGDWVKGWDADKMPEGNIESKRLKAAHVVEGDSIMSFWSTCCIEEVINLGDDFLNILLNVDKKTNVKGRTLQEAYVSYCKTYGFYRPIMSMKFNAWMKKNLKTRYKTVKIGGKSFKGFQLPPLEIMKDLINNLK